MPNTSPLRFQFGVIDWPSGDEGDEMPVKTSKRAGKYRVVKAATGRIAKNKGGTAVDGGGHSSPGKAQAQVGAVNTPKSKAKRALTSSAKERSICQ